MSAEDLQAELGLSEDDAQAIIDHVNTVGPITSAEDLREVNGLSDEGYDHVIDDANYVEGEEE